MTFGSLQTVESSSRFDLVVGGGGIPGIFAFAGAVQALLDSGITFNEVGGVSAGSIVASIVARGMDLEKTVREVGPQIDATFCPHRAVANPPYTYSNKTIKELLSRTFPGSMGLCKTPIHIVTSNITTQNQMIMYSGIHKKTPLADAIYASMAIPGVFAPMRMNDMWFVDGGLCSNNPVDDIFGTQRKVIAILGETNHKPRELSGPIDFFSQVINTAIAHNSTEDLDNHNALLINVKLYGDMLVFKPNALFIQMNWESGYKAAARALWQYKKRISS